MPVLDSPTRSAARPSVLRAFLDRGAGDPVEAELRPQRVLGRGRGAQAHLVEIDAGDGPQLIVEKHFDPPGLTRAVHAACFWAPFPYGVNRDAALACLHRRRVARAFFLAAGLGHRAVAEATHVRWCDGGHWVLGTEYVPGRPLAPPPPAAGPELGGTPGELADLLARMRSLERVLLSSGLVGSGWQVSTAAIVATSNFIVRPDGEMTCVDLESGIPALVVPRYVGLSLVRRTVPLFDDVDAGRLRRHLTDRRDALRAVLGTEGLRQLEASANALVRHSAAWKATEPALGRHGLRLLRDRALRGTIRRELVDRWFEEGRLDEEHARSVEGSRWLFLHPLVALGAAPTAAGRAVHRVAGDSAFRRRVAALLRSRPALDRVLREWQERLEAELRESRRIPPAWEGSLARGLRTLPASVAHATLARLVSRRLHRVLTDARHAARMVQLAAMALVSERVQERLAATFLERAAATWTSLGRLDDRGRAELFTELERDDARDSLCGFGMHLALKMFAPLTSGLKVVGASLLVAGSTPLGLLLLANTMVGRTVLTTVRWFRRRDRRRSYAVAFVAGLSPIGGTLAFALQLHRRRPRLSEFIVRASFSRVAAAIPIFGGRATRIEHALVRAASALCRLLTWGLRPFGWLEREAPPNADVPVAREAPADDRVAAILAWWEADEEEGRVAGSEGVGSRTDADTTRGDCRVDERPGGPRARSPRDG